MAKHLKAHSDEGRIPTPGQQILIDIMGAVLGCVDVRTDSSKPERLLKLLRGRAEQYGFDDETLVTTLRERGYRVDVTDTAVTISIGH